MKLIIGGAYQGKCEYAKKKYSIDEKRIFNCDTDGKIQFDCDIINHIEKWTYYCVKENIDPCTIFFNSIQNKDIIIISDDISCGIVPIDKNDRKWRETNGRLLMRISELSDSVERIFCGFSTRLK